jgi:hypothetical protein
LKYRFAVSPAGFKPQVSGTQPEIKQTVCHNHENLNLPGLLLRPRICFIFRSRRSSRQRMRRVLRIFANRDELSQYAAVTLA